MKRPVRIILLLLAALLAVAGFQWFTRLPADPPVGTARAAPWATPTYAEALDQLNRDVAKEQARVAADPEAWMRRESLAMVLHARGQLTGSHADLAAALAAADMSRAAAPDGSGPVIARAIVSLSMHRNAVAGEEVARMDGFAVEPEQGDRAEAASIMGDVALYEGKYPQALEDYRKAEALAPGPGIRVRLADWYRHMGDFDTARRYLEEALADRSSLTAWTRASVLLQLGAIDLQQGDWDAAEAQFAKADAAFPGWWLSKAHRAQMAAAKGDYARAEALYRETMADGIERPAVMEALSQVLDAQGGRDAEAKRLAARAAALWFAHVKSHPEAYADHAMGAALAEGDTKRAGALAAANYRARPYGDSRIGLARAALALGNGAMARNLIEELDRTGWRSSEQYVVLADACNVLRDKGCVEKARSAALAITPRAFDERAAFLSFGNH